jgi:hypothetical protein
MPIAVGINKQVSYKQETTWGTPAVGTGGKSLRRVTASFNLEKETYESSEIRTDYQIADMRHGVRSVNGSVSGELTPGTYSDFIGASLSRDFTALAPVTGLSLTIAVAGTIVITRASGSWLTDGIKIGDVVRLTAGTFGADLNKNLLVTALTALAMTVVTLNGSTVAAQGTAVTGAAVTVVGKKTFAPTSGHVDRSYTFEEFYSDIAQSEVTTGNKVNTVSLALPATGLVTCDFGFMGKDMQTGTTQALTSPTAQNTFGSFAAVNGLLLIDGVSVGLLTGLNININRNMSTATVVGSNSIQELFEGRIVVDGDFSAYFQDGVFRDKFLNEVEISIIAVVTSSSANNADFVSFVLPRVKVNSNGRDDGEQGITAQHSFMALLNSAGGAGVATERTTLSVQDSQG